MPTKTRERMRNKCTRGKLRIHAGIVVTNSGVGYNKENDHSLEPEAKSKQEKQKHKTGLLKRYQDRNPHMSSAWGLVCARAQWVWF